MKSHIIFCSGAGEVTGANFLLDTGSAKILIDCGLKQRELPSANGCDTANFEPFPYETSKIEALIVTHAHADHIGRIPKLARDGFQGVIHSTAATRDLAALMFDDALSVMEEHAKRHGCEPLYEAEDIERALSLWKTHNYHESFSIEDVSLEFLDAGHVLGSAMVKCSRGGRSVLFTGDLGNSPEPLLNDTESPEGVDYILMESVYGDRLHEGKENRLIRLREVIERTRKRGGTIVIPSFSIERTQVLLFEIDKMMESGSIGEIDVYLDSPLAVKITEVYRKHAVLLNGSARQRFAEGDPFSFKTLHVTRDSMESHAIHKASGPKVIIAGAGMSEGGRVRAHEKYYLEKKDATILFVGYQVPGSLGRRIMDGEKNIRIDGGSIRVRASVESISGFSGHKDRDALLEFVERAGEKLLRVFVAMGEPKSSLFLAQRIRDFLGVDALAPEAGDSIELAL